MKKGNGKGHLSKAALDAVISGSGTDRDKILKKEIAIREKAAETFDKMAQNADKDPYRRGWNGDGYRETAGRARESAENLKKHLPEADSVGHKGRPTKASVGQKIKQPAASKKGGIKGELVGAVRGGAIAGVIVDGGLSSIRNINAFRKGEKTASEATLSIAKDSAKGAGRGAVVGAASVGAKQVLLKVGARGLARSSAPIAIATTGLEVGKDVIRYVKGSISGEELIEKSGKNVAKGGTAWACAEGCALIGSCLGPFGTIVGGLAGGMAGFLLGEELFG